MVYQTFVVWTLFIFPFFFLLCIFLEFQSPVITEFHDILGRLLALDLCILFVLLGMSFPFVSASLLVRLTVNICSFLNLDMILCQSFFNLHSLHALYNFFNCIPIVYLSIWFTTVDSLGVGIIFYSSLYHKHISQYLANSKNLLNTWMNACVVISHSTEET